MYSRFKVLIFTLLVFHDKLIKSLNLFANKGHCIRLKDTVAYKIFKKVVYVQEQNFNNFDFWEGLILFRKSPGQERTEKTVRDILNLVFTTRVC